MSSYTVIGKKTIKVSVCQLFDNPGKGRDTNDRLNNIREDVLANLLNSTRPEHAEMRKKWDMFLHSLCAEPYDNVDIKKRGGRRSNHDFEISYYKDNKCIKHIKSDYKHNVSKITSLPQYFSAATNKAYLPVPYAQWYYREYLDKICDIYPGLRDLKPDEAMYLRFVYNDNYDSHSFFRALYNLDKEGTPEQRKQKNRLVKQSIAEYLHTFGHLADLTLLTNDIRSRQLGKVFILWDLKDFRADTIHEDELEITGIERIKNNNTIVLTTKAGSRHNMLLRWKNHLGVLYPAWQISLSR